MAAATESKMVHSAVVTYASMLSLVSLCPPFVILLWYTMVHADGSVAQTWNFLKQHGLQGFIEIWPRPTATAWKIIFIYGAFEAALQLFLPGKRVEYRLLPPTVEKEAVTKALTGVFRDAVAKGVQNISFGDLLGNLGTTMYKFKFRIPSYFSLVIRSLAVLEGIAISSDPNYKVLGSTYPWIAKKVLSDSSPQLKSSLQALLYKDGVFRIDRLESLLTEGTFVRDIIIEELAKGLDALGLATLDSLTSVATTSIPFTASSSFSLMTKEDMMNLRTLRRLMFLLSGFESDEKPFKEVNRVMSPNNNQRSYIEEEASLFSYQPASVSEILTVLSIIPELPPELQQRLLRLPADLAGRLISRASARTIQRIFL